MKITKKTTLPYIEFLKSPLCIAGVSTRHGGFSKAPYNNMNLGLNTGDSPAIIERNRHAFYSEVTPEFTVKHMQQMHSDIIHIVDENFENNYEGDAFYTTTPGILLTISTADCGSILLHDENFTICAALHCGWRGAHQQIIEKTISQLKSYEKADSLIAYIGPMIQQQNYEVGTEFLDKFPREFFKESDNKYYFDLERYIEEKLIESGVGQVHNCRLDTYKNTDQFYSYRKEGETGRINAFIGIVK